MRICLIASSQFPIREPFAGGLEAHTHATARTLKSRGHDVTLFAAEGSDPALGARSLVPERFTGTECGRRDVSAAPEEWMRQHHAYLGLMLQLAESRDFDVIHNNSIHHLPVAMSSLLKTPMVTTLHTPPTPWLESAVEYSSPRTVFVAVSSATARAWGSVAEASVITNGVDTDQWCPLPGTQRSGAAVWTGRLVPEKAPHLAIDAARRAGVPIILAGPVMEPGYYQTQIAPRLGEDAIYRGHLDHRELHELVASASAAVVSSQWDEPYGLVAAEAMSCGTPVAATPRGGLVEIVGPAGGVLARDDSENALAAAILNALKLPRERVRRYALGALSLNRMVSEYEQLYRALSPVSAAAQDRAGAA